MIRKIMQNPFSDSFGYKKPILDYFSWRNTLSLSWDNAMMVKYSSDDWNFSKCAEGWISHFLFFILYKDLLVQIIWLSNLAISSTFLISVWRFSLKRMRTPALWFVLFANSILLYTYWDLHTEKPQSKFSFANRCKPIKCHVSLFPLVRKTIHVRPIGSRLSCVFFACEPYGKLKFSFKAGWRGFVHHTSHRFASLKRANSFYSHSFHR